MVALEGLHRSLNRMGHKKNGTDSHCDNPEYGMVRIYGHNKKYLFIRIF